jgi:hypothetical protein
MRVFIHLLFLSLLVISTYTYTITKPECTSKSKIFGITKPNFLSTCQRQDGLPTARVTGEVHEFANQAQYLTGLDFLDGVSVDVEYFVLSSDFVQTSKFELKSIDVYIPSPGPDCPLYGSVIVTNKVGSQAYPVDPNLGFSLIDDPDDPITTIESVCGGADAYVDFHYVSDFRLEKNMLDESFKKKPVDSSAGNRREK